MLRLVAAWRAQATAARSRARKEQQITTLNAMLGSSRSTLAAVCAAARERRASRLREVTARVQSVSWLHKRVRLWNIEVDTRVGTGVLSR